MTVDQAHTLKHHLILEVLERSSVPSEVVRQRVQYASNEEIDAAGVHWIENVFWRGAKAWPNLSPKADANLQLHQVVCGCCLWREH